MRIFTVNVNYSTNQSMNQPINRSIDREVNQSINQWTVDLSPKIYKKLLWKIQATLPSDSASHPPHKHWPSWNPRHRAHATDGPPRKCGQTFSAWKSVDKPAEWLARHAVLAGVLRTSSPAVRVVYPADPGSTRTTSLDHGNNGAVRRHQRHERRVRWSSARSSYYCRGGSIGNWDVRGRWMRCYWEIPLTGDGRERTRQPGDGLRWWRKWGCCDDRRSSPMSLNGAIWNPHCNKRK